MPVSEGFRIFIVCGSAQIECECHVYYFWKSVSSGYGNLVCSYLSRKHLHFHLLNDQWYGTTFNLKCYVNVKYVAAVKLMAFTTDFQKWMRTLFTVTILAVATAAKKPEINMALTFSVLMPLWWLCVIYNWLYSGYHGSSFITGWLVCCCVYHVLHAMNLPL